MRQKIKTSIYIILGLGLTLAIIYYIGAEKLFVSIKKISLTTFLLIVLIYTFDYWVRGIRWQMLLKSNRESVRLVDSACLVLLGNFANLIIPAKLGDIARLVGLKRISNTRYSISSVTTLIDRVMDLLAVVILAVVAITFVKSTLIPEWISKLILVCGLLILAAFAVSFIFFKKEKFFSKFLPEKLKKKTDALQNAYFTSVKGLNSFLILTFYSVFIWLLESLIAYMIFLSIGLNVSFLTTIFAICIANITKALPVTPGNVGPYEGAMAAVFALFGVPAELSLTGALIDNGFKNLYTLAAGFIVTSHLGIKISSITDNQKELGYTQRF